MGCPTRRPFGGVVRGRGGLSGVRRPGRAAPSPRAHGRLRFRPGARSDRRGTRCRLGAVGRGQANGESGRLPLRAGQSRARVRKQRNLFARPDDTEVWVEPGLPRALGRLPKRQRVVVYLVHGYGLPVRDVAGLLELREATVRTHLRRGLASLRKSLNVDQADDSRHSRRLKGGDVTNGA